jgi:feruloyl esterase
LIGGSITFHAQLPFPDQWNGRLLHLGDGGSDGDLDFADRFVARGYATVNSNTGHDAGAEGGMFGFRNARASEDFAYRAVHFTTNAGKTLIETYYGKQQEYAYHFGCSTGGRQGLVAAQLFPYDFDGIIAGAPATQTMEKAAHRISTQQRLFADDFGGNLAFDADKDGKQESLAKVELLADTVLEKCDKADGIEDGVVEPPLCKFDPGADLPKCPKGQDLATCFTPKQIDSVRHLYEGTRNSSGKLVYPGAPLGSESSWPRVYIPHIGNGFRPRALGGRALASYLDREVPKLVPPDPTDIDYELVKDIELPEWGWWEFDIDDLDSAEMADSVRLARGIDPKLDRFLFRQGGKLLMYHGWADAQIPPKPTVDYHEAVVSSVFNGNHEEAAKHMRLFMAPGMDHCGRGPGPNQADYLAALDGWVTAGEAPETIVARHLTDGVVDNERPLCPYPERAVYVGRVDGINDPRNWVEESFQCR